MSQQPHQISFACPSCQTVLQVPLQMAGVTGPCPRCSTSITAPHPPQQPQQPQPPQQPQNAPSQQLPPAQAQQAAPPQEHVEHDTSAYRRVTDPTPDIAPLEKAAKPANDTNPTHNRSCLGRIIFPALFLSLAALTILGVLIANGLIKTPFLDRDKVKKEEAVINDEFDQPTTPEITQPVEEESTPPEDSQNEIRPEDTDANGATPPPPSITELEDVVSDNPNDSQNPSYEAVTRFFEATNLSERQKHFTFKEYSEQEIETSLLASEMPAPLNYRLVSDFDTEKSKGLIAYYGIVASSEPTATPTSYIVQLHRESVETPYKVNADALLDLYSPKLSEFSENPQSKGLHTNVILDAHRLNLNEDIPDAKEWGYAKIRTHPGQEEVFRAYFKLNSSMAEAIGKSNGPQWSNPTPAKVRLVWNNDDPAKPFIELLKIDHFVWKP